MLNVAKARVGQNIMQGPVRVRVRQNPMQRPIREQHPALSRSRMLWSKEACDNKGV